MRPVPPEVKQALRNAILSGKSRFAAAQEFNISTRYAYELSKDLPKTGKFAKRLTPEEIKELRSFVASGMTRQETAVACNIAYTTVCAYTKDLPSQTGKQLGTLTTSLLTKLVTDGYVIPGANFPCALLRIRELQKYVPVKSVFYKNTWIYFLEDRRQQAASAMITRLGRVIDHADYKEVINLFGLEPSKKTKKEFLGKVRESQELFKQEQELKKGLRRSYSAENSGSLVETHFRNYCCPSS